VDPSNKLSCFFVRYMACRKVFNVAASPLHMECARRLHSTSMTACSTKAGIRTAVIECSNGSRRTAILGTVLNK